MTTSSVIKLGLAGAHRTGKTSLAVAIAEHTGLPLIKTNTTAVFERHGLSPATVLDFDTRLRLQHQIIDAAVLLWQTADEGLVTDRTPIDFMAYTLADIQGHTEVDWVAVETYLTRCFTVTNELFTHLVVIPPAIPLVYDTGKAALNRAYMEHLHSLILGLCHDERLCLNYPVTVLPRNTIALAERVKVVLRQLYPLRD